MAVTGLGNSSASSSVNATTTPAQPTTLAGTPAIFLALGLGIVLFIGGPGLAIMLKAQR